MSNTLVTQGNIPEIIRNDAEMYPGNLAHYFRIVFQAQNCSYPYHNFRHMSHVLWLCYLACQFYKDRLSGRQIRNLLIAAMFHDFDHSGTMGDDNLNIERAVCAFQHHVAEEDRAEIESIVELIRATEYPYTVDSNQLSLSCQIIRDADLLQIMDVAWIQQVIFGLATEWLAKPIDVLRDQAVFLENLSLTTDWAQQMFPQELIEQKIKESREFLALLDEVQTA